MRQKHWLRPSADDSDVVTRSYRHECLRYPSFAFPTMGIIGAREFSKVPEQPRAVHNARSKNRTDDAALAALHSAESLRHWVSLCSFVTMGKCGVA